jgi:hemerythrin
MALIDWSPNFSVGIAQLDDEHKQLIKMINTLHDAMKQGKGRQALLPLLDELTDYALNHFAHEESLMVQHKYPEYEQHKKIHADFAKKISEYKKLHDQQLLSANQLLNILRDWLISHICNTDKMYGPFLQDIPTT